MSVQLGSAFGKVELDVSGVTKSVTSAQGSLGTLDKSLGGAAGSIGRLGTVAGTAGALISSAFVGAITLSINEAMVAEKVMAQTEAVVKSTGGAAGLTAQDIQSMASSLEGMTTFADDAIQSMENILLTFPEIKGDTFRDASAAILDMSTALGSDLQGAAIQVGKALQDPINGVTALRRVGVNFSEDQQKVIKSLVATGQQAEAQKLILAELAKEFGGSAAAATGTFDGKLKQLQNTLNNVAEGIGTAFIPVLKSAADALDVLINGQARIDKAASESAASALKASQTYKDYTSAVIGIGEASGNVRRVVDDLEKSTVKADLANGNLKTGYIQIGQELYAYSNKVQILSQSQWIASKAAQANASAADQVKAALERQQAVMGTVAAAHEQMQRIMAGSIMVAIAYTEEERKLAEKQAELEALNEAIAANGPRRTVMVQNEKMSAEELAKAKLQLVVATEKLGEATRKEGESEAEYELRLATLREKVADLSGRMGEHAAAVGGATKAQQEHKTALEAEIAAMQNATWLERAKDAMGALTKAYQDGRLNTEQYLERATVLNRQSNLYSDSALKAAMAQDIFIKALQDPTMTNYPTLLQNVKQGILDVGTSVETSGSKVNKLSKQDLLDMGVEGETAAKKVKTGAETATDAVERQVQRTNAAIQSAMTTGMQSIGTEAMYAANRADSVTKALNLIPKNIDVKINIITNGEIPAGTGNPLPHKAAGGPVYAGQPVIVGDGGRPEVFVPPTNGMILPSVPPVMAAGMSASGLPSSGIMGNQITLMDGAISIYPTPGMDAAAIAREVLVELGREANLATVSGMGWMGQ